MSAKRRHWKEKDGRFWARIAVPKALQAIVGKSELIEPLGGDRKVADRNHAAAVARLQALIDKARLSYREDVLVSEVPALRTILPSDTEQAAWAHYTATLAAIEEKRATMPTPAEIDAELEKTMLRVEAGMADVENGIANRFNIHTDYELAAGARYFDRNLRARRLAALRAAIPAGESRLVDTAVQEYVTTNGLSVALDSADLLSLVQTFIRAEIEALERSMEFDNGIMGGAPKDALIKPPTQHEPKADPLPLKSLFEKYIVNRQASGYHLDGGANWERPIEALIKFLGHDDARRITFQNLLDWRDTLLASGLSAKTVSGKHLSAIRAVIRWGIENNFLDQDVVAKVKQAIPRKQFSREKGYTDEEAVLVLNASLNYQPRWAPNPSNRESAHITSAKQWVPILCAFTGSRVTEMSQLRREDLRQQNGRWILRITPDAGSVKSGQYRDVPLHRQVETLGFIDFVKAAKPGPLFHGAKSPEKYLANARVTGGRLTEWLHDLKLVPDGVAPNHGWRHRFKTLGRELGMSDRVLDAVQGHPGETASDNYGDITMKARFRLIDALDGYEVTRDGAKTADVEVHGDRNVGDPHV